jgi:outer membrane protein assembly factor BamB
MADVDKTGTPSLSSVEPQQGDSITGLVTAEAVEAFDACYINSAGKIALATAAAADEKIYVRGYAARAAAAGAPVTLFRECRARYGAGLTPGANLYLSSTTPGGLVDAAPANAPSAIGYVVDATRVQLWEYREGQLNV